MDDLGLLNITRCASGKIDSMQPSKGSLAFLPAALPTRFQLANIVTKPRKDPRIKRAEYPREWGGKPREAGGARLRSRLLSRTPIWRDLVASVLCQLHISLSRTRYGVAARCIREYVRRDISFCYTRIGNASATTGAERIHSSRKKRRETSCVRCKIYVRFT